MAYLSGFKYDLFISYVHDNDQDGWVTRLHHDIQQELDGSIKGVEIWRDCELNSNTEFDEKIKKTIQQSALFLAVTSKRYLVSQYCRQELDWFYTMAKKDSYGLSVQNERRIFNVLIHDIEYGKWPKEYSGITGTSGFPLFDEDGKPLRQDEPAYRRQVRRLASQIEALLELFTAEISRQADAPAQKPGAVIRSASAALGAPTQPDEEHVFTIFLARSSSLLDLKRQQLIKRLQPELAELQEAVGAVKILNAENRIPPPYAAEKHDEKVRAEMGRAELVINLLNEDQGIEMEDQPETTYIHRQVELGMAHAQRQLIWIPKPLEIEITSHRNFIESLPTREHPATIQIVNDTFDEFCRVVKTTISEQIKQAQAAACAASVPAVLLSYDPKDRREVWRLGNQLDQIGVEAIPEPEVSDPEKRFELLKEQIARVSYLILIYGGAERSWLLSKAFTLMQAATEYGQLPKGCGIYIVSPRKKEEEKHAISLPFSTKISLFDNHDLADPQALKPLLGIA